MVLLASNLPLQLNYTNPEIIGKMSPLFGDGNTMLIFSAVIFGLGMRTIYRFVQEKKKGNPDAQQFDMQFFYTAIVAFISAGMPAMALMPSATATFNAMLPTWGLIFAWAFTAGTIYAANAGINALWKSTKHGAVTEFVSKGKLDHVIEERLNRMGVSHDKQEGGGSSHRSTKTKSLE